MLLETKRLIIRLTTLSDFNQTHEILSNIDTIMLLDKLINNILEEEQNDSSN